MTRLQSGCKKTTSRTPDGKMPGESRSTLRGIQNYLGRISGPLLDPIDLHIEAWFKQAVLDRPPIRFYHHNVEYEGGAALDHARWATLRDRWFDVEYQVETFERSIAGRTFHAETFPVFWPNLGPDVYSAFYGGELDQW